MAYLHIPPFEDQCEDRTKAETGNFIQSIQQLGVKTGRGGEGRGEGERRKREGGRGEEGKGRGRREGGRGKRENREGVEIIAQYT